MTEKWITEEVGGLAQMLLDIRRSSSDPFDKDICKICESVIKVYWYERGAAPKNADPIRQ
jgi:hypothetical protein